MQEKAIKDSRKLSFPEAISMLVVIVGILIWGAVIAKLPTGLSVLICAIVAATYGAIFLKITWDNMLEKIMSVFKVGMGAVLILLMVGMITGSWLSSGTTPMLIYYGLKIISPGIFLVFVIAGIKLT